MAARFLTAVNVTLQRLEQAIFTTFGRTSPPDAFCAAVIGVENKQNSSAWSIKDLIGDGFLWAVPRNRRTIEKRLKRKFGSSEYVLKILLPKKTLRVCNTCGDNHEVGILCPTCYKRIMDETTAMQDRIQEELKLSPVENEVHILYNDEVDKPAEFLEGKRIVEMKKPRPSWFNKNLTQQTTQQPATSTDVKPTQLG